MSVTKLAGWIATAWRGSRRLGPAIRVLSSLKLAVLTIVTLATVIAMATLLETNHGRQYAQWYIYHSPWFMGLLALLGVNVLCAALVRWPWKRRQTGFVITHAGLLILLAGSIQSFSGGVEGQIELVEGSATDQMTVNQRHQVTASWADRPQEAPYLFTFESGPVDWNAARRLDIGHVDGVSARILDYHQHGRLVVDWIADHRQRGGPLLRFQLEAQQGGQKVEYFLTDQDFGSEMFVGPLAIRLQRATGETMIDDFLHPPSEELGERGLLTIYHRNQVQRERVDDIVGKAIAIDDQGATVEVVQYLANPKLAGAGQFQSIGDLPRNPAVELRVRLPNEDQTHRQVAFAKSPLLNLDGVYADPCPVKFVYRHPAILPTPAVEFLQRSDGKLYGRTISGGQIQPQGEITTGSRLETQGKFTLTLSEYLPHARHAISFVSASRGEERSPKLEPAARVEISAAGVTETVWLQRNHLEFSQGSIDTPEGALRVQFGTARMPLGFSLQLSDFRREMNPGQAGNAAYSSLVQLVDKELNIDEQRCIAMNQPLTHRGLTLYQSSFRDAGHGREASIFSVAHDPGRTLKYAGSLMVCVGITTMFYMRAYFFQSFPRLWVGRSRTTFSPQAASETDAPREPQVAA